MGEPRVGAMYPVVHKTHPDALSGDELPDGHTEQFCGKTQLPRPQELQFTDNARSLYVPGKQG